MDEAPLHVSIDPLGFARLPKNALTLPRDFGLAAIATPQLTPQVRPALLLRRRVGSRKKPGTSLEREVADRIAAGDAPLFFDGAPDFKIALLPFHPGVSLGAFLVRQAEGAGRLDEQLACGVISKLAARLAAVHRGTNHRAGDLHDERVWLGFDGSVSLLGPLDIELTKAAPFAALQRHLTLDVWRLGALAAGLLTGERPVPPDPPPPLTTALTYEGVGHTPDALPPAARPLVERALHSVDTDDAARLADEFAALAADVDVERGMAAALAGLFPTEHARASVFLEELALLRLSPPSATRRAGR